MKCAVFSSLGLGDGLLALILSNNLQKNNWDVITFHDPLKELASWFPLQKIASFPLIEELAVYQRIFIFFEKTSRMQPIIQECLSKYRAITTMINPIATAHTDYPFWEESRFNGAISFADNLLQFCKTGLQLEKTTKENGISPPAEWRAGRFSKRVILHPTSSKEDKNWPKKKYLLLAKKLQIEGFEPVFALHPQERADWLQLETCTPAPHFSTLSELAAYVYESGYFIGNDSGIGHLASCLGLPTLTICRNKQTAQFWRPSWSPGVILHPSMLIPNIKHMRWRDKYWKQSISVNRVISTFHEII